MAGVQLKINGVAVNTDGTITITLASLGAGAAASLGTNVAGGVPVLDSNGLLPAAQLPPLAITSVQTAASQAAMLALTAQQGDVAIRTDMSNSAFMLTANDPTQIGNWTEISQGLAVALLALSGLTPAADTLPYFNSTSTAASTALTALARTLLAQGTAAAFRSQLGLDIGNSPSFNAVNIGTDQTTDAPTTGQAISKEYADQQYASIAKTGVGASNANAPYVLVSTYADWGNLPGGFSGKLQDSSANLPSGHSFPFFNKIGGESEGGWAGTLINFDGSKMWFGAAANDGSSAPQWRQIVDTALGDSLYAPQSNFYVRQDNGWTYIGNPQSSNSAVLINLGVGYGFCPATDNSGNCGVSNYRWQQVYAANGTINTSDAREKTAPLQFTTDEVSAAVALAKNVQTYKWLASIQEKGQADARTHIGMTVQQAIAIMQAHGLDPMAYGFICYDKWDATEAVTEQRVVTPALLNADGSVKTPAVTQDVEVRPAIAAGDRYSFRMDELGMFIARGQQQIMQDQAAQLSSQADQLAALVARVAALESK